MPHRVRLTPELIAVAFALCGSWGCSSPVAVPQFDAARAADSAMEKYDANHNERLESEEFTLSPGLQAASKTIDTDKDGLLTRDEIRTRLASYLTGDIALVPWQCRVLLGGRPLANAEVRLVPEDFLSPELKPARGRTDGHGFVSLQIDGIPDRGVYRGLYRLQVSRLDEAGKEIVGKKYNAETVLGYEVATDIMGVERGNEVRVETK